jgi:hypothetical protein
MKPLLDYRFNKVAVASSGGAFPLRFVGATVVDGPGSTPLGTVRKALDLGGAGRASVSLQGLTPDLRQFCVRIVAQANGEVTGRQNLVESSRMPFALFLDKGDQPGTFVAIASVRPKAHGWHAATTRFRRPLTPGVWYTIDLVYDGDTVACFVDGAVVSVQAFPDGRMVELKGDDLFVGTWVDGARDHFAGKVAALQLWTGIPQDLERQLDERRSEAEWFISHKRAALAGNVDLGPPARDIAADGTTGARVQHHARGAISYHDSIGVAFEIHGKIYDFYRTAGQKLGIGYLVSDEGAAGQGGRKSVFSKGAIYFSPATGAVPVTGQLFLDYEHIDGVDLIGFPTKSAVATPKGREQEFRSGRMYHRTGDSNAHEVHGAILAKYLATGGPQRWGFPVTNEMGIRQGARVGRSSEFESCTIYWRTDTGAHEVHGGIRQAYLDRGGPTGELGFPTSDELAIPGVSGGRISTFQDGSLCWYGSMASLVVARPFEIFLQRIDTRESEGFGMGQNDLYIKVTVREGSRTVYDRRHPSSGDWDGRNIVDLSLTLPVVLAPDDPTKSVTLTVDVWEADPGDDDHLGTYTKVLNAANGWGLREQQGLFDSGSFRKVRSLQWAVKPRVDIASLTEKQKFWGVKNRGTPTISYNQYAAAFRDVDSESEWWDVSDWLEKAFYELVVDSLAGPGNCFGMSLEAIYARKNLSRFALPLDRFTDWEHVRPEFNVKHCYQVGASAIWWFVGQFLSGNTHDPKDVFRKTEDAFRRGQHPVLCLSQNYDFSGAPHCILPVGWHSDSKPWRIDIRDPSVLGKAKELIVDPDANTFQYTGGNTYRGGEWSGGRLHYMPFAVLDTVPRVPVWDAILLILAGTIVVLGSDAATTSLTDLDGNDLDGYGERAKQILQAGRPLGDFFVGFKGFDGRDGAVAGELLLRRGATAGQGGDFIHKLTGTRTGTLRYGAKRGFSELQLEGPIAATENTDIRVRGAATSKWSVDVAGDRDKRLSLTFNTKLGAGRDELRLVIDKLPMTARRGIELELMPGLGGVELMSAGGSADTALTITGRVGGQAIERRYQIPLDGGLRVRPASAITEGVVTASRIDRLSGPALTTRTIEPL